MGSHFSLQGEIRAMQTINFELLTESVSKMQKFGDKNYTPTNPSSVRVMFTYVALLSLSI